jgi:hypothetical protein
MRGKMKTYTWAIVIVVMVSLCSGSGIASADLVWQTSKETAVSIAKAEGKYILLLGGRETCPNCQYMINTVFESTSPPIKDLIEQSYIPWYCDVDNSTEWQDYASGLGGFTLPLICIIDPNESDTYLDRTTDVQDTQVFYSRLLHPGDGDDDSDDTPGGGGGPHLETVAGEAVAALLPQRPMDLLWKNMSRYCVTSGIVSCSPILWARSLWIFIMHTHLL